MANFWKVVTDRETENTHCCTNPDFLRKKEEHNLPGKERVVGLFHSAGHPDQSEPPALFWQC